MENSEIPGRIQMERFIPVEIFHKKSNTFWGITIFRFLPKRPKFSVPLIWITRLHVERKRKIDRYFVNGTIQSRSCFRCQKNTSTIWQKFFTEISVQMVSAPGVWGLNSRSPARQTGAYPIELRIQCPFLSQGGWIFLNDTFISKRLIWYPDLVGFVDKESGYETMRRRECRGKIK